MTSAYRERRRWSLVALAAVTAAATFSAVSTVAAAFVARGDVSLETTVGSVAVDRDGGGGGALLRVQDGTAGSSDTGCLTLRSTGTLGTEVRHLASASGGLAPHLDVRVEKGTSTTGDDCSGFTPDAVSYRGRGAGVLYDGPLTGLGTDWGSGTPDPAGPGGLGGRYASTLAATPGRVAHWRLGDALVEDSFTAPAGTRVEDRAGESGTSWVRYPAFLSAPQPQAAPAVVTADGRVRREGGTGAWYVTPADLPSADYAVQGTVHARTVLRGDEVSLLARASPTARRYYKLLYLTTADFSGWRLITRVGSSVTVLGQHAQALTPGESYRLRLEVTGTTVRGVVDGVERFVVQDSGIADAGRAGFNLGHESPVVADDTDGLQLDDVLVVDASKPTRFRDAVGGAAGTWSGGPTSVPGALGGDDDLAVHLDGADDAGTASRALPGDLTAALWFRSTRGLGTARTYAGSAGLLHADDGGAAGDVGVGLLADGTVVAAAGDPGTSVTSTTAGWADGAWHHVAVTRVRATGALALYVDGRPAGSGTGAGSAAATGPLGITLGRRGDGAGHLAGDLDEVALWDRALSAQEVAGLVAANGTGAETWSTGETHAYRITVTVRDEPAWNTTADVTLRWEARNR